MSSTIGSGWLKSGKPPIFQLVPDLLSGFRARRLRKARVVWLNRRYFSALGIDTSTRANRVSVENSILDLCAFSVQLDGDEEENFLDGDCLLHADRYGGAYGVFHGGSARGAAVEGYIVKGIGRTSLAGVGADKYHSDGHLWLTEAIKDALYSEIIWFECPHQSIQTVAIIDTNLQALMPDGNRFGKRALLVRPFPIRLAHFERAFYNTLVNNNPYYQRVDKRRVDDLCRVFLLNNNEQHSSELDAFVHRVSRQIGACRFWRFSHDFLSSNTAIDGSLLDFGGFYGLSNWQRVKREASISIYQEDYDDIKVSIFNISSYLKRLCPHHRPYRQDELDNQISLLVDKSFSMQLDYLLGQHLNNSWRDKFKKLMLCYYCLSRKMTVDYNYTPPRHMQRGWLGDRLAGETSPSDHSEISIVEDEIASMLASDKTSIRNLKSRLKTALARRDELFIEVAERDILDLVHNIGTLPESNLGERVGNFIASRLGRSRRNFVFPQVDSLVLSHLSLQLCEMTVFFIRQEHQLLVVFNSFGLESPFPYEVADRVGSSLSTISMRQPPSGLPSEEPLERIAIYLDLTDRKACLTLLNFLVDHDSAFVDKQALAEVQEILEVAG